jgi:phosphoglycerate kinase
MIQSSIPSWNVADKTVIVRIDGNVPIAHQQILDDHKLVASLPTITYLLDRGAQLILLADIAPSEQSHAVASCRHLATWFYNEGLPITLATSLDEVDQLRSAGQRIILLENLELFPEERQHDAHFARSIAALASYYINDAFAALMSTSSTSTMLVPNFFDAQHKSIGFLIEHELRMLTTLGQGLKKPFLLFVGGVEEIKLDIIQSLLPKIDALYLGPALNFSFLKASGISVGMSRIAPEFFHACHEVMMLAEEYGVPIHYPQDYVIAEASNHYDLSTSDKIESHEAGISIGPKTATAWAHDCAQAHTIILHGLMGFLHRPDGLLYFRQLLQAIHDSPATSIITGSSTVAAAHLLGLAYDMQYCSTGGSTALAYLSNKPLPGLRALTSS